MIQSLVLSLASIYLLYGRSDALQYKFPQKEIQFGNRLELELRLPFFYELGEKCSMENGCLHLKVIYEHLEQTDHLGLHNETRVDATTSQGSIINLYSRDYEYFRIYEQVFANGIPGTSTGNKEGVATGFPIFRLPNPAESPGLRYVTPGGYMLGWTLYSQGSFQNNLDRFRSGESGGIVGLIDPSKDTTESVVMSALTEPMAANVELVKGEDILLQWGVQGLAESIPTNYSIQFILVFDEASFNRNVMRWGELIQSFHGKTPKLKDQTLDYLGYWTDNGAAHYYNPLPFKDYQTMLLDVYNYTVKNGIPVRYVQLDSWWYYKGEGGGVKDWTAKPDIFPDGIEYLHSKTGWPILAHNRYFSNDTDYAQQNGGKYPFTIDDTTAKALPLDKRFWDDLFDGAKLWGLSTYEQDWMDRQYEDTSALHTNTTLGSWWLNAMGTSAAERDIAIQYCMSFPRHFLHSVMLPAVTQIRVSDDYLVTPNQWRIGTTSLFAHALGLKPVKDNFWTSKQNKNVVFNDCELVLPYDPDHPLKLRHFYDGTKNVTQNDEPCVPWTTFGYDSKYPHSGLRENFCRNPADLKTAAFCYTKASFDIPEEEWEWDFCKPPFCQEDCYTFNGVDYLGSYGMRQSGRPCVDWNGKYGLNGTKCRNPTYEEAPWCYVSEDHSRRDFCDNKCTEGTEPNSNLQSAVATLSTGPVGIGDKAENLNKNLIMKSCRADGLLLKPSKPLTAIDLMFISLEYKEIWTTESIISNSAFGIIFLAEVDRPFTFSAFELNLESALASDVVLFQNYPVEASHIQLIRAGDSTPLSSCGGYLQFCLFYTSPLLGLKADRVAILGETSKWTPISSQRIKSITVILFDIQVIVSGVKGEVVSLLFWEEQQGETFSINCNFVSDDDMTVSVITKECS